ncbi:hypothetical protein PSACC_03200 [Paramicrosporidium saccamoebae]|uniref:Autophagy-related protein 2 n=1 Tax=Paramicrosporidium saccamoebae TaxID=1246581 RepID=A0A2H9TGS6_9FUNG|nr:hypothetical protein PSACC_03200 [Paramicrosporidium saccamoebae]
MSEMSIRLDYKPKKVDFKKFANGNFVELLNLFELEDAELQLPPVTVRGISGTDGLLNSVIGAWLPFVRNTQMPQVMSGITPVRTLLNLGGGMTDFVLLPIEQYKKNGRIFHGLKKGTRSMLHQTALETARLGKKIAVGTQVILEQADDLIENDPRRELERCERKLQGVATTSKYSAPPSDATEGLLSAYGSLSTGIRSAAQTVIAVPIQVYERRGPGGAVKAVLRAMPIAFGSESGCGN